MIKTKRSRSLPTSEGNARAIKKEDYTHNLSLQLRPVLIYPLEEDGGKNVHMQQSCETLRALYNVAQDGSQLTFSKGDIIFPLCDPTSGWQFGKNMETQDGGWFPVSYTCPLNTMLDQQRNDDKKDNEKEGNGSTFLPNVQKCEDTLNNGKGKGKEGNSDESERFDNSTSLSISPDGNGNFICH